ncbi:MAG TPA: TIGR02206 family membrane protein, partial [Marmoricola sp.]
MAVPPLATDGFQAFTAEHAGLLALLLLGAVVLGRVALRQRADDPVRFRRRFALLIPVFTVPFQVLQLLPGDFTLGTSLPIQVCDLSWMVAVWALWTRDARAVALLYFWGLTLDVQAAVTPSLDQTFPDPRYFMFWGMHFLTFWATVYVVCLAGGPSWRGYRFALGCTAVWAAAVMGFNGLTDTNYGYLSRKPDTASLLDLLGPWPLYVVAEVAVLAGVWALMTWPWVRARRTSIPPGRSAGAPPASEAHEDATR